MVSPITKGSFVIFETVGVIPASTAEPFVLPLSKNPVAADEILVMVGVIPAVPDWL